MYDKKFYTPGVVPPHGIGVTGNKIKINQGENSQKVGNALGKVHKKFRNKSLSKTANYKNPLRGLSPDNQ